MYINQIIIINIFFISAEGGLDAILGLLGKRDIVIPKGAWDDLLSSLQNGATNLANQLTSRI